MNTRIQKITVDLQTYCKPLRMVINYSSRTNVLDKLTERAVTQLRWLVGASSDNENQWLLSAK